ncbi:hypothetical protein DFH07DRAFT_851228 [Mycena maculata]|uniref:Uncharacterized protein n=1 Tax=Mycena maculata TaxID=230809 RepID=A0AAD7MR47_9AGAR|nr:hypothetical protein DFH07DRAFT_851228 [Mycena maculata]
MSQISAEANTHRWTLFSNYAFLLLLSSSLSFSPPYLLLSKCSLPLSSHQQRSLPTGWTARSSARFLLSICLCTFPTRDVKISARSACIIPSSHWTAKDTIVVPKLLSGNKLLRIRRTRVGRTQVLAWVSVSLASRHDGASYSPHTFLAADHASSRRC